MVHQQQKVFQKFPLYIENLWQQGQDFHLKFYSDHDMRDFICQNLLHLIFLIL